MADRRITFLPATDTDLAEIRRRITQDNGVSAAMRNIDAILHKIELLSFAPNIDSKPRRRPLANGRILRFALVKRWWIVYEYRDDEEHLIINGVIDTARDLSKLEF